MGNWLYPSLLLYKERGLIEGEMVWDKCIYECSKKKGTYFNGMPEWLYCHIVALYIFCAWYDLCCVAATVVRMRAERYLERRSECRVCTDTFESKYDDWASCRLTSLHTSAINSKCKQLNMFVSMNLNHFKVELCSNAVNFDAVRN